MADFNPDQFLASTAPADSGSFDPDKFIQETNEKSVGGFAKNLGKDAVETAHNLVGLGEGLLDKPVDTVTNVVKGLPGGIVSEGKRIGVGELLTGHPINAIQKLGQAAYDKPLTTGLDVAPAVGALGKMLGIGGKVAEVGDAAATGARVGEAGIGAEDAAAGAAGAGAGDAAGGAARAAPAGKPLGPLGDFLNSKYGAVAAKPGFSNTLADYLQRSADQMSLKNIGGSVRQVRQLGADPARDLGQYAIKKGYTSPGLGDIGLGKRLAQDLEASGKKLGDFRKMADDLRDPVTQPIDVLQEIRAKYDPKYLSGRGVNAGEASAYKRALEEVEDAQASHQGLADAATKINKWASDNKLKQATGAASDVANTLGQLNNSRIKALLGDAKAAQYDQALSEYGALKKLDSMHQFKEAREAAGRLGPGGGIRHMAQHFLDQYGYRAGAQIADSMAKMIRSNPSVASTLPAVYREFVHQVEELLPEDFTGGQYAHGGVVGMNDELENHLSSKYGKKEKQ